MDETMAKWRKIKRDYNSAQIFDLTGVHLVFWGFLTQVALSSRGLEQVVLRAAKW